MRPFVSDARLRYNEEDLDSTSKISEIATSDDIRLP